MRLPILRMSAEEPPSGRADHFHHQASCLMWMGKVHTKAAEIIILDRAEQRGPPHIVFIK